MANVMFEAGWVCIPYGGNDRSVVQIAVGDQTVWSPAFRDWADDTRVVKVRPPSKTGPLMVWLSVDGHVTQVGVITL